MLCSQFSSLGMSCCMIRHSLNCPPASCWLWDAEAHSDRASSTKSTYSLSSPSPVELESEGIWREDSLRAELVFLPRAEDALFLALLCEPPKPFKWPALRLSWGCLLMTYLIFCRTPFCEEVCMNFPRLALLRLNWLYRARWDSSRLSPLKLRKRWILLRSVQLISELSSDSWESRSECCGSELACYIWSGTERNYSF